MAAIRLENVGKVFKDKTRIQSAATNVNLTIEQGDFVFIIGGSGAGKTTMLRLISGELEPDRGAVYLYGQNYMEMTPRRRQAAVMMFGHVWQESQLMKSRTVFENLFFAALVGEQKCRAPKEARIRKVLGLVGMTGAAQMYPEQLSLGECRRIELARALVNNPSTLILDEMTANLDNDNIWDIFLLLNELNRLGTTIIMATHAKSFVDIMRRRVITLVNGQVIGDVRRGRYGDIV